MDGKEWAWSRACPANLPPITFGPVSCNSASASLIIQSCAPLWNCCWLDSESFLAFLSSFVPFLPFLPFPFFLSFITRLSYHLHNSPLSYLVILDSARLVMRSSYR